MKFLMASISISLPGWAMRLLALLLAAGAASHLVAQGNDEVSPDVQQLYAEARAAQQHGDTAAAISKYRAMIKAAPHLAAAYNNLGMLYFDEHDYPHAAETLKRGLELNPQMPTAAAMLGMSYFQLGENEKAEPLLRAALRINPSDDNVEMILCRILINLKKYDEAASYLKKFLDRNPKNQEGWYLLGKTYLQMSEDSLAKINQIDPNSVVAHEIAGEIDESMHNYDLALVEYKKAIDLAPHQPGTHMHMANAFWLTAKWASAEQEFKAELENDPNNCTAHWKLANAMLEAEDPAQDALSELDNAIDRCPTLMQARADRGRALIRLGKPADALPDLLMAEKDSPSEPSLHFLLASVYRAQGKSVEAQQEMVAYSRLQKEASDSLARQASDVTHIKSTEQ
jgi:tetratricopeptide (TPR) repeat protein